MRISVTDHATDVESADLVSELEVMKKIGPHKNIISLIGCCRQNGKYVMSVSYIETLNWFMIWHAIKLILAYITYICHVNLPIKIFN